MNTYSLLSQSDVAKRLNTSVATLQRWRKEGRGPKVARMGGRWVYRETDVDQFVQACFSESGQFNESSQRLRDAGVAD